MIDKTNILRIVYFFTVFTTSYRVKLMLLIRYKITGTFITILFTEIDLNIYFMLIIIPAFMYIIFKFK